MNKFVIRGQFPILPGRAHEVVEAAHVLRERVLREDQGVLLYEFFVEPSEKILAITEAYADEPSLIAHIRNSDFSRLFAPLDFAAGKIQIHGNASPALKEMLGSFGPFELFLPI